MHWNPSASLIKRSTIANDRRAGRVRERPPLPEFVHQTTPAYIAPWHLQPLTDALEFLPQGGIRLLLSVPPRHFKTSTILAAMPWTWLVHPQHQFAYVSHGADFAKRKSLVCQRITQRAGFKLDRRKSALGDWWTTTGGHVQAVGISGGIAGDGFHTAWVDDPYAKREEAESLRMREKIDEGIRDDIMSREEPDIELNVIIVHTRYHVDDQIGRMKEQEGWTYVNLPAINEQGEALCPKLWPVERLLRKKNDGRTQYSWESLYQGNPRARGSHIFQGVMYSDGMKPGGYVIGIGVDLAWTSKTSSDWSVAVVMGWQDGLYYVLNVIRAQIRATDFAPKIKELQDQWPGATTRFHGSGMECAALQASEILMDLDMDLVPTQLDKMVRASEFGDHWNDAPPKVAVVRGLWNDVYVNELHKFTGLGETDDQVDGSSSAFSVVHDAVSGEFGYEDELDPLPHRVMGLGVGLERPDRPI